VTIYRNGAARPVQTVRIEFSGSAEVGAAQPSSAARRGVIIFGIQNHPTLADTDLAIDDRFTYDGGDYQIMDVLVTLGEIQAQAERLT
jgi:hypothetical protein